MSALTEGRNTVELAVNARTYNYIREAAGAIYAGGIVAQNSAGKAVAASDAASLIVLGRADATIASGDNVVIRTGAYIFANGSGGAALAVGDIGSVCYVVDDQTVGKTGGTNSVVAGVVLDVTDDGVAVLIDPAAAPGHVHAIAGVTGLQAALDAKADVTP